jgi:hypothetical protein
MGRNCPGQTRVLFELAARRRKRHRQPEISNDEKATAGEVVAFLAGT